MKSAIFLFAFLTFQTCKCQDNSDDSGPESGLDTAACIFGCLGAFERKGVEGPLPTNDAGNSTTCENLDIDSLVSLCSSYAQAGTCLDKCVNSETKKIIIGGLDYICVRRLSDFKNYVPCWKSKCGQMEDECGDKCGTLASAEGDWLSKLGMSSKTGGSRRKRENTDDTVTTTDSGVLTTTDGSSGDQGSGVEDSGGDTIDTCQFVKCYVNCSRPTIEKTCGKDAYDLFRQTSRILLSFIMVPLEQTWAPSSNASAPELMNMCDGLVSQALTAESSATIRPTSSFAWSILLVLTALLAFPF